MAGLGPLSASLSHISNIRGLEYGIKLTDLRLVSGGIAALTIDLTEPHSDTVAVSIRVLETVSVVDEQTLGEYIVGLKQVAGDLEDELRNAFGESVALPGEPGPWPLWDWSPMKLQLYLWRWIHYRAAVEGRTQENVTKRLSLDYDLDKSWHTVNKWRQNLRVHFSDEDLRLWESTETVPGDVDIRQIVRALNRL